MLADIWLPFQEAPQPKARVLLGKEQLHVNRTTHAWFLNFGSAENPSRANDREPRSDVGGLTCVPPKGRRKPPYAILN